MAQRDHSHLERTRLNIEGMTCADCAATVEQSLSNVSGVDSVTVSLAGEHVTILFDPASTEVDDLRNAVVAAGYRVRTSGSDTGDADAERLTQTIFRVFGLVVGVILVIVVVGEVFGVLDRISHHVPWFIWLAGIIAGGYQVFRNVITATLQGRIIAHTLMTVGMIAALAVGEWPTAAVVVFFMRIGEHVERMTMSKARGALRTLTEMMPRSARVERGGVENEVPLEDIDTGDIVRVRPGERIPADGEVLGGNALINQASITGESMPLEIGPGDAVFASTIPEHGSLRIRVTAVGEDTTFGGIIRLVEEAESNKGQNQRLADGFAYLYLPVVIVIAALTLIIGRDPMAMTAVLVVACSCSFALATPIAILASVGSAARRGLLVKGGRVVEALASADVILIDKTGTMTTGRPVVQAVHSMSGFSEDELFTLAASAEMHSEHPIASAIAELAREMRIRVPEPERFEATPGMGVRALVDRRLVEVGNERLIPELKSDKTVNLLESAGHTVVRVRVNGRLAGLIAVSDEIRPDVRAAIKRLKSLGFARIEMLTGDNERVASALARHLGIRYRAGLLPEDKIEIIRAYQARSLKAVMVGDGVNDAPALAQADAGIALGASGTDIANSVAHVSLMRDDWRAVPELFQIARRTVRVIKLNLGFTAAYNIIGLGLAAFGILPPVLAAAAQSIPDVGILLNSSRLLRHADSPTPVTTGEGSNEEVIVEAAR
jgi:P-type Cu+ transporter